MKNSGERGIVYFPPGIYVISETIQITDSTLTLSGDGPNASAIRYKGDANGNAITFLRTGDVKVLDLMNCAVRDLRIEADSGTYSGVGLYLSGAIFFAVERVHVRYFSGSGGTGMRIDRSTPKDIISQDIYISNVHLQGNDVGLIVDGLFQGTAINLMVDQNLTAGAKFSGAGAFTWQGGLVQGGGDYGVQLIEGIDCFEISGVYFETDTAEASFSALNGTISDVTVTNCRMTHSATGPGRVFLEFEEVKGFFLSGNKIQYDCGDTVLKATNCVNGVVAGGHTNIAPVEQFDVTGNGLIWIGGAYNGGTHGAGIAVDTFKPPQQDALFGSFAGEIGAGTGRPPAPILGRVYFDSNLSPTRPIWFNGSDWVDANGSAV